MTLPGRARVRSLLPALTVLAALLVSACTGGGTATEGPGGGRSSTYPSGQPIGPAGPAPTTIAGYDAQKLRWRPCHSGFQCARMLVPFDYSRPAWKRFSLPVIRLPASDRSRRIGSLVINPGGPGGSGVDYALQARSVISAQVRARFDVAGFDPRGVGGSVPAVHCLTGPQLDRYFATSDSPVNAAQRATVVSEARLFAQGCQQHSSALLPYVGTRDAARDMDVLRAALGDRKLTYLGKSYGTYLGAWYAQLFPSHVRALVLDGAVNPDSSAFSMNEVQARGFEVALHSFTADCLQRPTCPLGHGGSVNAAIGKLQGLLNRAAHRPLSSRINGQPGDSALLLNGVASALYSKSYWGYLRTGLTTAFAGDGTLLIALGDALVERGPDGTYTNLVDANTAVDCVDRPWPKSLLAWQQAAGAAAKAAPQFGAPIMWGSLPCAYWPVRPDRQVRLRAAGAPPILVVGTTRDPATPFAQAQALARELSSGVLLGWNGDGHTAYRSGSACVDAAVDKYLISLVPPGNGAMCP